MNNKREERIERKTKMDIETNEVRKGRYILSYNYNSTNIIVLQIKEEIEDKRKKRKKKRNKKR